MRDSDFIETGDEECSVGTQRCCARVVDQEGQTMAEYAVVLAVIAIGIFVALGVLSGATSGALSSVASSI